MTTWKWWQFHIKIAADWRRYRENVASQKRQNHLDYISDRPATGR